MAYVDLDPSDSEDIFLQMANVDDSDNSRHSDGDDFTSEDEYDQYEEEIPICCICGKTITTSNFRTPDWDYVAEQTFVQQRMGCHECSIDPPLRKGGQAIWELCYIDKIWTSESDSDDIDVKGYVRGYLHNGDVYCTPCYSKHIYQGIQPDDEV